MKVCIFHNQKMHVYLIVIGGSIARIKRMQHSACLTPFVSAISGISMGLFEVFDSDWA